jgi:hypothetical protein
LTTKDISFKPEAGGATLYLFQKTSSCNTHYLPYPFFLGYSSALLKKEFPEYKIKTIDACALDMNEKNYKLC